MGMFEKISVTDIRTHSARKHRLRVTTDYEGVPPTVGMSVADFLNGLPKVLKAGDLLAVARSIVRARQRQKPVIVMLGGHIVKTGCSPILIDLAAQGFLTHFASNGAAAIHDTELARFGQTSENVAAQLADGSFGMAADTASLVNEAPKRANRNDEGFGEAMGALLLEEQCPHKTLIGRCYQLKIPYTLHVAIGTDIVHQHPSADGAAIGEATLRDFRIFSASVSKLGGGGVVLNLGSAVVMPEVFLKALSVTRNLGHEVNNFVTANFDMIQHYRPLLNVVQRPVLTGGTGYGITGHHEIMIPLLAAAIVELAHGSMNEAKKG